MTWAWCIGCQTERQRARQALDEISSEMIDDWLARQKELTLEQRRFLEKALSYYEEFTRESGETAESRATLARAHWRVGNIHDRLGLRVKAEKASRQALGLYKKLAADSPTVPEYQSGLGGTLDKLAGILHDRGELAEARKLLEQAISHQQAALEANPRHPPYQQLLRNHYSVLAETLLRLKDHAGAAKAAQAMAGVRPGNATNAYEAACYLAPCVTLAATPSPPVSLPQRERGVIRGLMPLRSPCPFPLRKGGRG